MLPAFFGGVVVGFLLCAAIIGWRVERRGAPEPLSSALVAKLLREEKKR